MNIVGLDLSLRKTGVVVLSDGLIKEQYVISFKMKGEERLYAIYLEIKKILDGSSDDLICVEDYAMAIKGGRSFSIGELGGVVKTFNIYKEGYRYRLVAPSLVKKFATGRGNSKKNVMLKEVYKRWNIDFDDDDLCDAFVLAKIGEAILNPNIKLTKFQKEVVDKIGGK